jgi:UDP-glucose 4-epimerase
MASRGSVIPLFIDQVLSGQTITVTDPDMTRFMMTIDDAVDLVLYAFANASNGDIFVQKSPAATIKTLVTAILQLFNKPDHPVRVIGTRHGEKVHETLLSREEMAKAKDLGSYYCVRPDDRDLNYDKFFEQGEVRITESKDYNSDNTARLDVEATKTLLLKLEYVRDRLSGKTTPPIV